MKKEKRKNLTTVIIVVIAVLLVLFAAYLYLDFQPKKEPVNYKEEWLEELPSVPNDLLLYKRDIITGDLSDICRIEEVYWKNPELYPKWEENKISHYLNHDYSRWGAYGYGVYPADAGIEISNLKEGKEIELCTFLKASFNIETYQGIVLKPTESEYFDIEINPDKFLLEPTFPKFGEEWVKKLKIKITAKQDVPEGDYVLGFNVVSPEREFNEEMVWEVLRRDVKEDPEYLEKCIEALKSNVYFSDKCEALYINRMKKYVAGGSWSIGRLSYTVIIRVK